MLLLLLEYSCLPLLDGEQGASPRPGTQTKEMQS